MPWIEAVLRGQKVFAKASASGALASEGGRVEIRYKANDGRAYRAAAANLVVAEGAKVLPEDACAPAEAVASKPAADAKRKPTSATAPTHRARWIVYTDGACSGNPGPAGAGLVVVHPSGKMHEGFEFLGTATNNIAELTAILRALEALPAGAEDILVHTDSKYAIGVLTLGWKPKTNQALITKTKALVSSSGAKLTYVAGHAGVPLNERADELAREAIRTRRSQLAKVAADAPAP